MKMSKSANVENISLIEMTYAGIRWIEVSTIIGFIILQIVLIHKQKYISAMIASVVYIPGAYFLKHFLYGTSAAVGTIKGKKYLNTLTNDRELRGSPARAPSALRNSDAPRSDHRVAFTGIPELQQNGPEQLTDTMIQAGITEAPTIFSRSPISIASPSQVVDIETYDRVIPEVTADTKALRQQQSIEVEARRQQEMAAMSYNLAQKFSNFNNKFSAFKSQFSQHPDIPRRVQNTNGPIRRV
tara:strand:- start:4005 stop:4730 length:726 start_codon:yes stop_codon:yes gene_type:complete